MTLDKIKEAEAAYRAAFRRSEKLRAARNEAVRAALAAGISQADIAKATGLTRGRINQLRNLS